MNTSREEHLQWCKDRALQILETGEQAGAIASMLSDLGKWREPLYDPATLRVLMLSGTLFTTSPAQVKRWIEGFA